MDDRVIVIAGPTASGKTAIAIRVARELRGEIVSADSRQIYRYMDVGTAKPTPTERSEVPHHLIDCVNPDTPFSAAEFAAQSSELIEDILARNLRPIVVGGAGFYLEALFDGLSPVPSVPAELKQRISADVRKDVENAFSDLRRVDPDTAEILNVSDPQRIARALEVYAFTGEPISYFQSLPRIPATKRSSVKFCLSPDRSVLYDRINRRTVEMFENGLVEETKALFELGYDRNTYALKTFGYREICAHLADEMDLDKAMESIQTGTRHYAKRQLTWFRNRSKMSWLDPTLSETTETIAASIREL
jgi:tRNA dimethylallyltransferase